MVRKRKTFKKKTTLILFLSTIIQFIFFPFAHYYLFNKASMNYSLESPLLQSIEQRMLIEMARLKYDEKKVRLLNNILQFENPYVLRSDSIDKANHVEYLDQILLVSEIYNPPIGGGGGIIPPQKNKEFVTLVKGLDSIKLERKKNESIETILNRYLTKLTEFNLRQRDLRQEVNLFDFWFTSVSLFKFNEIIPISIAAKLIWLIQAIFTFFYLFLVSTLASKFLKI